MSRKSPSRSKPVLPPVAVIQKKTQRIRDWNTQLAVVIKDDRLSGHRRLLTAILGKYFSIGSKDGKEIPMTEQQSADKQLLFSILAEQYGNPRNIQWLDRDDVGVPDSMNRENVAAVDKIREAFDAAMRPAVPIAREASIEPL